MPALIPTEHSGRIVWLGHVTDRDASLRATPTERLDARFTGVGPEEAHSGDTRPSCARVTSLYPLGTTIRNVRQLSIVSQEELAQIAAAMDLDSLDPAWIGATIVVEGLKDFSHLPPSSRLQTGAGTTLVIDMQNQPCHLPAKVIDAARPGAGAAFKAAAKGLRGVTAWVEREGPLATGDDLRLFVPEQRAWAP